MKKKKLNLKFPLRFDISAVFPFGLVWFGLIEF